MFATKVIFNYATRK